MYFLNNLFRQHVIRSIFVNNSDIYCAGYINDYTNWIAAYWINNTKYNLTDGSYSTRANTISVTNGHIYIIGEEILNGKEVVVYWKDGVRQDIFEYVELKSASLYIYSEELYVCIGTDDDNGIIEDGVYFWYNGETTRLNSSEVKAKPTSIFVTE